MGFFLCYFGTKIVSMIPFLCRGVGRPPARTGRFRSSQGARQAGAVRSCQHGRMACPFSKRPPARQKISVHFRTVSLPLGPAPSGQRAAGQRCPDPSEEAPGPGDVATAQGAAAPQPATQPGVSWQGTAGGVICFLVSVFAQKKARGSCSTRLCSIEPAGTRRRPVCV